MFCVIYEFTVMPEKEAEFKSAWHDLTLKIQSIRGGLGSRLHKKIDENNLWIAYAQWPNRETWQNRSSNEALTKLRNVLVNTCVSIRTVYELDVVDDLLS